MVLNSLGWQRDMIVDIQTGIKEDRALSAYQEDGTKLESETLVIDAKTILRIRVPEVSLFGYKTVWLREVDQSAEIDRNCAASFEDSWETAYYRLKFNERGKSPVYTINKLGVRLSNRESRPTAFTSSMTVLFYGTPGTLTAATNSSRPERPFCWRRS